MTDTAVARITPRRQRVPFIVGCARSGTTWLGKVFDSHPDVLYLHEPDIDDRGLDKLPYWFAHEPVAADVDAAGDYLDRLLAARSPRATGTRPIFAKTHRGATADALRRSLIVSAKGCEFVLGHHARNLHIPDLSAGPKRIVVKSVSALGRLNAMLKARPDALHPILLVRHPCGYVASQLRGLKLGVMDADPLPVALAETRAARRLGVSEEVLRAKDAIEKSAWTWTLANAEAAAAVEAAGGTVVFYEALLRHTPGAIKDLFAAAGLWWPQQTEIFLRQSWEKDGSYYSVFRDPTMSAHRWCNELDDDVVAKIRSIACRDAFGERAWREDVELKLAG